MVMWELLKEFLFLAPLNYERPSDNFFDYNLSKKKTFKKTQRDGMGREEGGGFRVGNTCIPVADSF